MSVKPKTAWMVYCRFATYYVSHHRASFPVLLLYSVQLTAVYFGHLFLKLLPNLVLHVMLCRSSDLRGS